MTSSKTATRWRVRRMLLAALSCIPSIVQAAAPQAETIPTLQRDARTMGPVPIPAAERDIPTVVAERWMKVSDADTVLEGATFDRQGDLLLCDVRASRVLRLSSTRRATVLLDQPGLNPGGLAVDQHGRLFVAAPADMKQGTIGMVPVGQGQMRQILPPTAGYVPNDLVFDRQGGFYFTDFKGSLVDPSGGIYHVGADMRTVTPIVRGLALANGIALSPDGRMLWATEYGKNRLLQIELEGITKVARLGLKVAYQFIGPAPDSMRVDGQGNAYVAMNGQGRVLVFSPGAIPIGQILLPGRDEGHNMGSASLALKPGTDEVYIVSNDGAKGQGANVFRARTFTNERESQ